MVSVVAGHLRALLDRDCMRSLAVANLEYFCRRGEGVWRTTVPSAVKGQSPVGYGWGEQTIY